MSPPRRGRVGRPGRPSPGDGPPSEDWPPRDAVAEEGAGDRDSAWEREWGPPIPVDGGLVATTRRGRIGSTWWSRRFLDALESVMVGGRMASGRAYARKGQVVALAVGPGVVEAPVQGSREDPYEVRLVMPVVPGESWDRIVERLASQAGYAARMLAGDLPHEIAEVFDAEGESLLPAPHSRLTTSCTCPDFENPCKHVAAVCYILAEALDRDPFELLAWRGRGREELLSELRARRGAAVAAADGSAAGTASATKASDPGPGPIRPRGWSRRQGASRGGAADAATFYGAGPGLSEVRIAPAASAAPDAVLRQLPSGVLEMDGEDLAALLSPFYRAMSADAARRAVR